MRKLFKEARKLLCRHNWEHLRRPNKFFSMMVCSKCGKIEQHGPNKRYLFSSKAFRDLYCWCPKCNNDLVRDSYLSQVGDIVLYECSWCGNVSEWSFGTPIPTILEEVVL